MSYTPADTNARSRGYTEELHLISGDGMLTLSVLVPPGTDTCGTLNAWDLDEQEWIVVNGWLFERADA